MAGFNHIRKEPPTRRLASQNSISIARHFPFWFTAQGAMLRAADEIRKAKCLAP